MTIPQLFILHLNIRDFLVTEMHKLDATFRRVLFRREQRSPGGDVITVALGSACPNLAKNDYAVFHRESVVGTELDFIAIQIDR